jgi:hypothetical protein
MLIIFGVYVCAMLEQPSDHVEMFSHHCNMQGSFPALATDIDIPVLSNEWKLAAHLAGATTATISNAGDAWWALSFPIDTK